MSQEKENKKIVKIQKLDDLSKESKFFAEQYSIELYEIIPSFLSLEKQAEENNKRILFDLNEPNILSKINQYIRDCICATILSYELIDSELLSFPSRDTTLDGIIHTPFSNIYFEGKDLIVFQRTASPEICNKSALSYLKIAMLLSRFVFRSFDEAAQYTKNHKI